MYMSQSSWRIPFLTIRASGGSVEIIGFKISNDGHLLLVIFRFLLCVPDKLRKLFWVNVSIIELDSFGQGTTGIVCQVNVHMVFSEYSGKNF